MTLDQHREMLDMEQPFLTSVRVQDEMTRGVDLKKMSNSIPPQVFRHYIGLCRLFRKSLIPKA